MNAKRAKLKTIRMSAPTAREKSCDDLQAMVAEAYDNREARNGFTEAMEIVYFTLPKAFAKDGGPTSAEVRKRIADEIYRPMLGDNEFTEPVFEKLKKDIFDEGGYLNITQEVVAYCVFAVRAYFERNEVLSWSYACDARYWAGVVMVVAKQRGLPGPSATMNMLATLRSSQARAAAFTKLANDPKQAAKAEAFKLWQEWQAGRARYKSGAAFARHVIETYPILEDPVSAGRWVTQWRKHAKAKK